MKHGFTMVHDYGTGAVIVRIYANSLADVVAVLRPPKWKPFSHNDPWIWSLPRILQSDIDQKESWLEQLAYIGAREAEGKTSFPVRGRRLDPFQDICDERNLWA